MTVWPALAQDHMQKYREEPAEKTPAQLEADKQAARAYQRSLNAVPDQKQSDPWGIARGDDAAKKPAAAAKPAMKSSKAKTGTTSSGGTTNQ
ncbi:hypothetical protein [Bradyrhizobium sp. LTSPM299]|uniref:hypothetical protein n=1 Tax=Bradyrhizobium sp. LTSPM299 TaxID=1619233 RepID=UPI001FD961B5|nr:hypothetical protein [Bradyrhizobium sp. LTSPM299]